MSKCRYCGREAAPEFRFCPFCGGEADFEAFRIYGKPAYYGVRCRKCSGGIRADYNTEAHAAERWNRRTEPKSGRWVISGGGGLEGSLKCSVCGSTGYYLSPRCPNCGADMKEVEDHAGKD